MTEQKVRLIVRADDAGSSWSSNMGCLQASENGLATSVEVMMPCCAWVQHAAELFNPKPEIDIGIHLTLTSEWDAIKWRPLSDAKSLTDDEGNFRPLLRSRANDHRVSLADTPWDLRDIEREFRAQIQLGKRMFKSVSHVSAHMAQQFSDFDERVGQVVAQLCEEFGLMEDPLARTAVRLEAYAKFPRSTEHRVAAFIEQLSLLYRRAY